jgi:hypothetical protein
MHHTICDAARSTRHNEGTGPGVATRYGRRQKPRFLPPETKAMSEKVAEGDFLQ